MENINFFKELEEQYPIFKTISEREKYLLMDMYTEKVCCISEQEIALLQELSKSKGTILNLNDEKMLKAYNQFKYEFLMQVYKECESLPKSKTPKCDLIIGPPGAGKSKIIKRESSKHAYKADADYIKSLIAKHLNVNINSPDIHELSSELRNKSMEIAVSFGCDLVIEKIGDNTESLLKTINRINESSLTQYEFNLYCMHCRESISRARNAMRFKKYDTQEVSARMVEDKRIKEIAEKPIETYYEIVHGPLSKLFKNKRAYICEMLFEPGQENKLNVLNDASSNDDKKFEEIKQDIFEFIFQKMGPDKTTQAKCMTHVILKEIYNTTTKQSNDLLYSVEHSDLTKQPNFLTDYYTNEKIVSQTLSLSNKVLNKDKGVA